MHVDQLSCRNPIQKALERVNELAKVRPVGCRDYYTLEFFQKHKIPACFSGCLTLTLQRERFSNRRERSGVVISDCPYISLSKEKRPLFPLNRWLNHKIAVKKIREIVQPLVCRWYHARGITHVSHEIGMASTHQQRFIQARGLLATYANAGLVHCAFPCIATGPLLFLLGIMTTAAFRASATS